MYIVTWTVKNPRSYEQREFKKFEDANKHAEYLLSLDHFENVSISEQFYTRYVHCETCNE